VGNSNFAFSAKPESTPVPKPSPPPIRLVPSIKFMTGSALLHGRVVKPSGNTGSAASVQFKSPKSEPIVLSDEDPLVEKSVEKSIERQTSRENNSKYESLKRVLGIEHETCPVCLISLSDLVSYYATLIDEEKKDLERALEIANFIFVCVTCKHTYHIGCFRKSTKYVVAKDKSVHAITKCPTCRTHYSSKLPSYGPRDEEVVEMSSTVGIIKREESMDVEIPVVTDVEKYRGDYVEKGGVCDKKSLVWPNLVQHGFY